MKYELYCKRNTDSFKGKLSLICRDDDGRVLENKSFRNLDILTGVRANYKKEFDWVRGVGGIPEGSYFVHINPKNIRQLGELNPTGRAIGQAYHVSSNPSDLMTIWNSDKSKKREAIMIHPDNDFPGSIGCIVLPNNTKGRQDFKTLVKFLSDAFKDGNEVVSLVVFR